MPNFDDSRRFLVVTADDFGIGPATTRGILDLAERGLVTSTVLLVNSPHAEQAVELWRASGCGLELGWHPCLTLDAPILSPWRIPSLVDSRGRFLRLGGFLKRMIRGHIRPSEVEAELRAQYRRFEDLTGMSPPAVNAHHHIHVFRAVGGALTRILTEAQPYLRRVCEPMSTLRQVPGARIKRLVLDRLGRRAAKRQQDAGFPGNDYLLGITDPPIVEDREFFLRWLRHAPGRAMELSCHPGYLDLTLDGRDGTLDDGHIQRRPRELERLQDPRFREMIQDLGFELVSARELSQHNSDRREQGIRSLASV